MLRAYINIIKLFNYSRLNSRRVLEVLLNAKRGGRA